MPSLLSHASVYLPSHPFQTIPQSHFATFFFFFNSCYSQLGISVSPYLFMEILKFFSLIGQLQCVRCSAGRQKLKKMAGCDLSGVAGVKVEEIDCPTKA